MSDPLRNVIALVRVSGDDQAKEDRTGLPRQHEDIELHCRRYNLKVVKTYEFAGLSGAHVQKSKRFREMLSELSKPSIAGVVFATLDRFFRPENLSAYQVFQPFETTSKHLFCELGELDPKDSQDQMKIVIWGQQAGFERERIRDRMVRGKNKNRHRGDLKSDTLPRGVVYDKGRRLFSYTPDAQRVKRAFERILKGDTLAAVAEDLGFRSPTAMKTTLRSYWWMGVKASLKERVGKKWDETRDKMTGGRKSLRAVPILVDTNLTKTPLVSKEVFYAVQDLLGKNHTQWTQRRSRINNFLCSGLLYCECGKKMYHKTDTRPGKPSYYLCASNYNQQKSCGQRMLGAAIVDREVWARIMLHTKSEKYIAEQIKRALSDQHQDERRQMVKDVERLLASLQKRKASIIETIEYNGFSPALGERLKALEVEIAEASHRVRDAKAQVADIAEIDVKALAHQIKQRFWSRPEMTLLEKKAVLAEMVERITLQSTDDDLAVQIRFRIPVDAISKTPSSRNVDFGDQPVAINKTHTGTDSWPLQA